MNIFVDNHYVVGTFREDFSILQKRSYSHFTDTESELQEFK